VGLIHRVAFIADKPRSHKSLWERGLPATASPRSWT